MLPKLNLTYSQCPAVTSKQLWANWQKLNLTLPRMIRGHYPHSWLITQCHDRVTYITTNKCLKFISHVSKGSSYQHHNIHHLNTGTHIHIHSMQAGNTDNHRSCTFVHATFVKATHTIIEVAPLCRQHIQCAGNIGNHRGCTFVQATQTIIEVAPLWRWPRNWISSLANP